MLERTCKICRVLQPVENFYLRTDRGRTYRRWTCKGCLRRQSNESRRQSEPRKDKAYLQTLVYRQRNPEKVHSWRVQNQLKRWRIKLGKTKDEMIEIAFKRTGFL